jgi:hypothetical protein
MFRRASESGSIWCATNAARPELRQRLARRERSTGVTERAIFWGAMRVGVRTRKPPTGARKRRVQLAASAIEAAMPTLVGRLLVEEHNGRALGRINRVRLRGEWMFISGSCNVDTLRLRGNGLSWKANDCRVDWRSGTVESFSRWDDVAVVGNPASHGTTLKAIADKKSWWRRLLVFRPFARVRIEREMRKHETNNSFDCRTEQPELGTGT